MQGATCLEMQLIDVTKGIFKSLVLLLDLVFILLRLIVCHLANVDDGRSPMERGGGKRLMIGACSVGMRGVAGLVQAWLRPVYLTGANNLDLQVPAVSKLRLTNIKQAERKQPKASRVADRLLGECDQKPAFF